MATSFCGLLMRRPRLYPRGSEDTRLLDVMPLACAEVTSRNVLVINNEREIRDP